MRFGVQNESHLKNLEKIVDTGKLYLLYTPLRARTLLSDYYGRRERVRLRLPQAPEPRVPGAGGDLHEADVLPQVEEPAVVVHPHAPAAPTQVRARRRVPKLP